MLFGWLFGLIIDARDLRLFSYYILLFGWLCLVGWLWWGGFVFLVFVVWIGLGFDELDFLFWGFGFDELDFLFWFLWVLGLIFDSFVFDL